MSLQKLLKRRENDAQQQQQPEVPRTSNPESEWSIPLVYQKDSLQYQNKFQTAVQNNMNTEILEGGWDKIEDATSQNTFYYNHFSGQTCWRNPGNYSPIEFDSSYQIEQESLFSSSLESPNSIVSASDSFSDYPALLFQDDKKGEEEEGEFSVLLTDEECRSFETCKITTEVELWSLLQAEAESNEIPTYIDISSTRNPYAPLLPGFNYEDSPICNILFTAKSIHLQEDQQLRVSLWNEVDKLSDDFIISPTSDDAASNASTMFIDIRVKIGTALFFTFTLIENDITVAREQFAFEMKVNGCNRTWNQLLFSCPYEFQMILKETLALQFLVGVYYDSSILLRDISITHSLTLSMFEMLAADSRNDIYISIAMNQFLLQASNKQLSLPVEFGVEVLLMSGDGELIDGPYLAELYPKSFPFAKIKLSIPDTALNDFEVKLVTQIVCADNHLDHKSWQIPKSVDAPLPNHAAQYGPLNNVVAYSSLSLYSDFEQLQADGDYELSISQLATPQIHSQFLSNIKVNTQVNSKHTKWKVTLPLQLKSITNAVEANEVLYKFIDENYSAEELFIDISSIKETFIKEIAIHDAFRFHKFIFFRIFQMYNYQEIHSAKSGSLVSVFELFTYIISLLLSPKANDSLLHTKIQNSLYEVFQGGDFLYEYLNYSEQSISSSLKAKEHSNQLLELIFSYSYLLVNLYMFQEENNSPSYLKEKIGTLSLFVSDMLKSDHVVFFQESILYIYKNLYPPFLLHTPHSLIIEQLLLLYHSSDNTLSITTILLFIDLLIVIFQNSSTVYRWQKGELFIQIRMLPVVYRFLKLGILQLENCNYHLKYSLPNKITHLAVCINSVFLPALFQILQQNKDITH